MFRRHADYEIGRCRCKLAKVLLLQSVKGLIILVEHLENVANKIAWLFLLGLIEFEGYFSKVEYSETVM